MMSAKRFKFHTVESNPLAEFMGIPVQYSPYHRGVCDARGIWPRKRIMIGPLFNQFDMRIQQALLHHEARHCLRWHLEQRIALVLFMYLPLWLLTVRELIVIHLVGIMVWFCYESARQHEIDADRFAVKHGYGAELLKFLKATFKPDPSRFYPNFEDRCNNIEKRIKETK